MKMVALMMAVSISGSAQEWAKARLDQSPRHREWVAVKHDGRTVQTLVVYPEAKEKAPVILVIHEIFGLTDWAQEVTDQFAAAGYIAVAPDLLSGMGTNGGGTSSFDQDGAIKAIGSLEPAQITVDLNAVADYALKLPSARNKLFVTGFCWGGGQSFRFATNRQDLASAFVFYGPPPDKDAMARIHTPVYGFYGGNDARIDSTIEQTKETMKNLGKTYDPTVYEGAGHGFMRAGEAPDATDENKKAREASWERIKRLLKEHS
jgi:carboxymethylenebutenolidase